MSAPRFENPLTEEELQLFLEWSHKSNARCEALEADKARLEITLGATRSDNLKLRLALSAVLERVSLPYDLYSQIQAILRTERPTRRKLSLVVSNEGRS